MKDATTSSVQCVKLNCAGQPKWLDGAPVDMVIQVAVAAVLHSKDAIQNAETAINLNQFKNIHHPGKPKRNTSTSENILDSSIFLLYIFISQPNEKR